ncbi:MAG: hypothetical protein ACRC10_09510 [Thermoguttaceae bacterium]
MIKKIQFFLYPVCKKSGDMLYDFPEKGKTQKTAKKVVFRAQETPVSYPRRWCFQNENSIPQDTLRNVKTAKIHNIERI